MDPRAGDESGVGPGSVLDDRYRLEQVRAEQQPRPGLHAVLWRAVDLALGRPVAVLLVDGLGARAHKQLADAAASASRVADARFVRVLDVGRLGSGRKATSWVATEWVDGPTLAAAVRGEPMHPYAATTVVRDCAEALAAAERGGLVHGRLHPDQLLLPATGVPRLTGLGIGTVLHEPDSVSDDVRGLGALLFAALTGRWPLTGRSGLAGVDARAAASARPRLVRAGIPREVDEVTHRMLAGAYPDAQACARALAVFPRRAWNEPPPPEPEPRPSVLARWAWRVVPPVVVVAIGLGGWAVGSDLGRVPTAARQAHAAPLQVRASAPGAGVARLVWKSPPSVTGFDPEGDGQENNDQAGLAVDHDPTTAWTTDVYRGSSHLGGLKSGVGLLIDLGRPTSVRVIELALTQPGADVEIRAGDAAPSQASDLSLVAHQDQAGNQVKLTADPAVSARYWLVWFTNLPKVSGGYQVGVAEVALLG